MKSIVNRKRTILHIDMDAFFASVEVLDDPTLKGKPVVVGGVGSRGVVASASYEARASGVQAAMPTSTARRRCPGAVFLPPRHGRYSEISDQIMEICRSFTPLVEPRSLDAAYLDVTGSLGRRVARRADPIEQRDIRPGAAGPEQPLPKAGIRAAARTRRDMEPLDMACELRRRVIDETGMACSVGVGPNKLIAKLASERAERDAAPSGAVSGAGGSSSRRIKSPRFPTGLPVRNLTSASARQPTSASTDWGSELRMSWFASRWPDSRQLLAHSAPSWH